jgi:hypothetical protein
MNRRDFLQAGAIAAGAALPLASSQALQPAASAAAFDAGTRPASTSDSQAGSSRTGAPAAAAGQGAESGAQARTYWLSVLTRLAEPVLTNLAQGTLKARMPCEAAAGQDAARRKFTHLEAFGRLLAGIAPWLDLPIDDSPEGRARARYADLARRALIAATTPSSPDFLNFTDGAQALVDAAFLAQAILRAPRTLWDPLDGAARAHVTQALLATRTHLPGFNNWLLFAATVEAALLKMGANWDRLRVDYALRQHEQWYKGDGVYGDGPEFHWDYYNSFVIQPMLLDVLDACATEQPSWQPMLPIVLARAQRYAAIQERLIAPDGSYPAIGRSLAYRCGAFHLLADLALRRALPESIAPAQARHALTLVMRRTIEAPGTFDNQGWLRIGLCGHQPGVGETYISTGSLYLCSVALLPLGLPAADPFWAAPAEPITAERAWNGQAFPIDHALSERR